MTTRPVRFSGGHLFVNADVGHGELRVEVLDRHGNVIDPFTLANCKPVADDSTLQRIEWKGRSDLETLEGKEVRFRFSVTNGALYSFWVSPSRNGASQGYVAAGGPGFTGPVDTLGDISKEAR